MRAKALLEQLIAKHPEWNWEDLEDQGFFEMMQAFRFAPEGEQTTVVLAFTIVKEYIRRLLALEEQRLIGLTPKKLSYENKLYNNGYNSGVREFQLRAKKKKTRIEKKYIEIADKFNIDLQTVILLSSFVNGYNRDQRQVIQWARKQYTHNKNNSYGDYYRWLSTFLEKLSPEDFNLLNNKQPYDGLKNQINDTDKIKSEPLTPESFDKAAEAVKEQKPVPISTTGFILGDTVAEVNGKKVEVSNIEITLPIADYLKKRVEQIKKEPKHKKGTIALSTTLEHHKVVK